MRFSPTTYPYDSPASMLARGIIGGLLLSTLVIVPIYYILFDRFAAYLRTRARLAPSRAATTSTLD